MANKVKYGLSNVHIFPITQEDAETVTYGNVIKIPGAVSLSLKPEGSSDPFYADNIPYHVSTANNGYSGDLEMALIPDDFLIKILGQTKDEKTGALTEGADDKNTPFALAFQFEGDVNATRHIIYKCTATRPEIAGETKSDKVDPKTETLTFTVVPRMDNHMIKAKCEKGGKGYDEFFNKPLETGDGD